MASATVTVTGYTGPGVTATAVVITDVASFTVNVATGILQLNLSNGVIQKYAISAATTFTVTISGGNYTVTIS
jgi:hypothetical protein